MFGSHKFQRKNNNAAARVLGASNWLWGYEDATGATCRKQRLYTYRRQGMVNMTAALALIMRSGSDGRKKSFRVRERSMEKIGQSI